MRVKPAPFEYHAPATLAEAVELLGRLDDAKVLAGGQSLVPALNMRLAQTEHLVDLGALTDPGLHDVTVTDRSVVVGALVTHADLERDEATARALPLLRETLHHVAHPAIRNRGTTVGSLVHADPNGEMPAILALTGGRVDVRSATGKRTIEAADLVVAPLESSLRPDEIAVRAHFDLPPAGTVDAYDEFARRSGDYALAGVAVRLWVAGGAVTGGRASFVSVTDLPDVLDLTPALRGVTVHGGPPELPEEAARAIGELVAGHVQPETDIHADAEYRRHLAVVLTRRVVLAALARVGDGVAQAQAQAQAPEGAA